MERLAGAKCAKPVDPSMDMDFFFFKLQCMNYNGKKLLTVFKQISDGFVFCERFVWL